MLAVLLLVLMALILAEFGVCKALCAVWYAEDPIVGDGVPDIIFLLRVNEDALMLEFDRLR